MKLELVEIIAAVRELFYEWGVIELPSHQGILPLGWLHPDLFFRHLDGIEGGFFSIQPVIEGACGLRKLNRAVGTIIWWQKPFSTAWLTRISELLAGIQLGADTPLSAGFETIGRLFTKSVWEECGCGWDILWKGCRIGEVRIMGDMAGRSCGSPVGIAVLNLEAIAGVWSGDPALERVIWAGSLCVDDLKVWDRTASILTNDSEISLRTIQSKLEEIRMSVESALEKKNRLNAFLLILEGIAMQIDLSVAGPTFESVRRLYDGALRQMCRRLIEITSIGLENSALEGEKRKEAL